MAKNLTIILFFLLFTHTSLYAQKKVYNKDSLTSEQIQSQGVKQSESQDQIQELNNKMVDLSQKLADTKQAFYDSRLNLWNYILAGIALLFVIVTYVGIRNITDRLKDIKEDNQREATRNADALKETKADFMQRLSDIKQDIREFKTEQNRLFEKFQNEAHEKIRQGLDTELSKAIEKVMKGSFESVLNDLSDQINILSKRVDNISEEKNKIDIPLANVSVPDSPINIDPQTNVFDDEQP